jgi:hypothetical protein
MSDQTLAAAPAAAHEDEPGVIVVGGKKFMRDAKARLVPLEMVKPVDLLVDQTVRKMMAYADELSAVVARFKGHSFDDVGALEALISEKYEAKLGGAKGNITITTVDGCMRVQVQVQDQIEFGPELQAAKALVDECISEWSEGARSEIRALVLDAFQVDKAGLINRGKLFQLRRINIRDDAWLRAMEALSDSIRVIGSKTYMRFYRRENPQAAWKAVTIDMAAA